MKFRSLFGPVLLVCGMLVLDASQAQVSIESNSPGAPGDYVGWDGNTTVPLEIRHNGNQPIEFYTDSIQRMQLWPTRNSNINGYGANAIRQNGFVGISNQPLFFSNAPGAFSRLHLCDSTSNSQQDFAQQFGYRNWMRNGITFTGNSDQGYIGQQYVSGDATDMVIQWSDNPQTHPWGSDRLKIVFASNRVGGTATGMSSEQGMEAMRFWPANPDNVNVGVGDFFRAGVVNGQVEDPTERLHVNDGTIRIDSLVPDYNLDTLSRVVMVDSLGRMHWRRINTWPSLNLADCEWVMENPGVSGAGTSHQLYTAHSTSNDCPDSNDEIGIGTSTLLAGTKVTILENTPVTGNDIGLMVTVNGNDDGFWNTGINVDALPTSGTVAYQAGITASATNARSYNIGVKGRGVVNSAPSTVSENFGVVGETSCSHTSGTVTKSYGVYANAVQNSTGTVTHNYGVYSRGYGGATAYGVYGLGTRGTNVVHGVYGYVDTASTPATTCYAVRGYLPDSSNSRYAGYFQGRVKVVGNLHVTGTITGGSDALLKTNVEDLENASELIAALQPKTYNFVESDHPGLHFPSGQQLGLLAQEVEEILPQLVRNEVAPAEYDSLGNQTAAPMPYKSLNYIGLIPVLIAAMQEQQEQLGLLQEQLAACCAVPSDDGTRMLGTHNGTMSGNARALTIQPNPFNERTTLYYTLERGGRMQLMANSADGKQLRVLQEASLEAGQYQHEWQTSELTPGVYYVTLLLDGEPIVKKAVKVQR